MHKSLDLKQQPGKKNQADNITIVKTIVMGNNKTNHTMLNVNKQVGYLEDLLMTSIKYRTEWKD